jgi:hypothetical protein
MIRLLTEYQDLVRLEIVCGANWGREVFKMLLENSGDTLEIICYADERGPVVQRRHIWIIYPKVLKISRSLWVLQADCEDYAENVGCYVSEVDPGTLGFGRSDNAHDCHPGSLTRCSRKKLKARLVWSCRFGGCGWTGVEDEIKEVQDSDVIGWMDDLAEILGHFLFGRRTPGLVRGVVLLRALVQYLRRCLR